MDRQERPGDRAQHVCRGLGHEEDVRLGPERRVWPEESAAADLREGLISRGEGREVPGRDRMDVRFQGPRTPAGTATPTAERGLTSSQWRAGTPRRSGRVCPHPRCPGGSCRSCCGVQRHLGVGSRALGSSRHSWEVAWATCRPSGVQCCSPGEVGGTCPGVPSRSARAHQQREGWLGERELHICPGCPAETVEVQVLLRAGRAAHPVGDCARPPGSAAAPTHLWRWRTPPWPGAVCSAGPARPCPSW